MRRIFYIFGLIDTPDIVFYFGWAIGTITFVIVLTLSKGLIVDIPLILMAVLLICLAISVFVVREVHEISHTKKKKNDE